MLVISLKAKQKIKRRERVSNVLVFLLFFVLFLVVFGGLCIWAVVKINEERQSTETSSTASVGSQVSFGADDTRRLLIVTVDGSQAQGFVAVCTDPADTKITALSIPRDTVVDVGTTETRLYELYTSQGISAVESKLKALTGISFDNYAVITYPNIKKLINYYESGLILTLNEDLNYSDSSMSISISGGVRTLSADQVVSVLRYPSWHGGRKARSDIQAQVVAALINEYMRSSRQSLMDDDFSSAVNLVTSDILVSHYNAAKEGLTYLASKNSGSLCTVLSLNGEYKGSGNAIRYYAADTVQKDLKPIFG